MKRVWTAARPILFPAPADASPAALNRFRIALSPALPLIVLPLALLWRFLLRPRFRRRKSPAPPASAMP